MENENIEYKKSLIQLKEGLISIVAILNKHKKGTICFSAKNVNEKTLRDISQTIANHIEPKIYLEIKLEENYIIINFNGNEIPYFAYGRCYIRVADEDKKMTSKELENFILKKNKDKLRWDNEICENATINDIDEETINKFKQRYEEINKIKLKGTNKDILKSIGCLKNNLKITNAGILLFSKNSEKFFPMNYITIARYPGNEYGNEYLDIKHFYGNLFDLVDNADKYIRENIKEKSIVLEKQIPRKVIPQYPYYAIREIITNAVIHRDYSNYGSRIIIRIFNDRIEFNSPGSLPDNVTPENIVYEQNSRNPIIAEVFQKIKYIEKMGEGWDKIIDNFKNSEYDVDMPKIIDTKNTVIVKIFSPKEMVDKEFTQIKHKSDANPTRIRRKSAKMDY
jgi:ATP-dependent DNA helicase RecG